jgi:outer membrane lipoprotein LolB
MAYLRLILIGGFSLLLVACAGIGSKPITTPAVPAAELEDRWERHQQAVEPITQWKLNGKAAVNSGNEGGTATVIWDQYANRYTLEFYGILGHGRTRLESSAQETRLYTAEGPQLVASDAQGLLGEYTGWYLPVDNMFYWIRGLPSKHLPIQSLSLNAKSQLQQLQQAGWTITYEEYMQVNGIWLPQRLNLKHPGNSLHPMITVKWISKSWVIPSS